MPFHAKKIDDHTLINLLRQGYWEAFEDEFFAYPIGPIDILAKDFISKISLSRFGAAWAASAMTKNPRLAIESLRFGGYEVPLLDWFIINMALPPELVEPLCASMPRKCSSRDLPFYCMTPNHAALFPAVFNLDPNAGTETNLNGKSLIDTAISASDPTILSIALNTLMQHQNPSLLQWEHWAELALTVEDKASHLISAYPSRQELNFDNPTSLPTGLQCIAILFNEKPDSFDFSKCKSTTVLAWFAHQERSGIHEGTQSTPPPSATHQPRL